MEMGQLLRKEEHLAPRERERCLEDSERRDTDGRANWREDFYGVELCSSRWNV